MADDPKNEDSLSHITLISVDNFSHGGDAIEGMLPSSPLSYDTNEIAYLERFARGDANPLSAKALGLAGDTFEAPDDTHFILSDQPLPVDSFVLTSKKIDHNVIKDEFFRHDSIEESSQFPLSARNEDGISSTVPRDCISIENCKLNTIDSNSENIVIVVKDDRENYDLDEMSDARTLDHQESKDSSLFFSSSKNDTNCLEAFAEADVEYQNEPCFNTDSYVYSDSNYPNPLCLICGSAEVCSKQTDLDHQVGKFKVVELLMNLLNTTREILCVRSEKICFNCVNILNEIEDLKESVKMKEAEVKNQYMAATAWIHTLANNCEDDDLEEHKFSSLEQDKENLNFISTNDSKSENEQAKFGNRKRKVFRCLKCHTSFNDNDERKSHMRSCHLNTEDEISTQDPHLTPNSSLSTNKRKPKKHNPKKLGRRGKCHKCDHCDQVFTSVKKLQVHAAIHPVEFNCHVCGRFLTTRARLDCHLFKFHNIGKPKRKNIRCDQCEKCFSTKAGLTYHRNVVHQVGSKYVCEHCDKVYYFRGPYRSHLLFAHGKKKVVCDQCGQMFFTVAKLNIHINTVHRNVYTWECTQCPGLKFNNSTSYRHHKSMHKNKFTCNYCPQQFERKLALYAHMKEHSAFSCKLCKETFPKEDLYNSHLLNIHGLVSKANKKRPPAVSNKKSKSKRTKETNKFFTNASTQEVQVNINDLLLNDSYNSANIASFDTENPEDNNEIRVFNLLGSSSNLAVAADNDTSLSLNENVSFYPVQILENIGINRNLGHPQNVTQLATHDHLQTFISPNIHSPQTQQALNVSNHHETYQSNEVQDHDSITAGPSNSFVGVDGRSPYEESNEVVMDHLTHQTIGANVEHEMEENMDDLRPTVAQFSPDINIEESVVGLTESMSPSHLPLDSTGKSMDPSNIWIKDPAWPSSDNLATTIEDLGISVIDSHIVVADEITDTDNINMNSEQQ